MAIRPAWTVEDNNRIQRINYTFSFNPGFSVVQKQKNIEALHTSIGRPALEVSTKSFDDFGIALSAFRLKIDGKPIECIFQASKEYEKGGPYIDLLYVQPKDAKRDERHHNSGKLLSFLYEGKRFPLEPKTVFYDYLYVKAVKAQIPLKEIEQLLNFDFFTDIEFNPKKSINCQAKSVAIIKAMLKMFGEIPNIDNFEEFKKFYSFIQADKA